MPTVADKTPILAGVCQCIKPCLVCKCKPVSTLPEIQPIQKIPYLSSDGEVALKELRSEINNFSSVADQFGVEGIEKIEFLLNRYGCMSKAEAGRYER